MKLDTFGSTYEIKEKYNT